MTNQKNKKITEFKAGIFILLSVSMLVFSIMWLRFFAFGPSMKISINFTNPGPIIKGLNIYYKGLSIGRVSSVEYSHNFENTIVYVDIYKKNLTIPENVFAEIKQEGIAGQKYIDLISPIYPSDILIENGSVLKGKTPFGISEMQDFFQKQINSGRLDNMMKNLDEILENTSRTSANIDKATTIIKDAVGCNKSSINAFLKNSAQAAANINETSSNINTLFSNEQLKADIKSTANNTKIASQGLKALMGDQEFNTGLKETVSGTGKLLKKTNSAIDKISSDPNFKNDTQYTIRNLGDLLSSTDMFMQNMDKEVTRNNLIENMSCAFQNAGLTFKEANEILNQFDDKTLDASMKELIVNTLQNTNQAALRIDCLGSGMSDMLSKRFLLFKLMFGKPGEKLENCDCLNNSCPKQCKPSLKN